MSVSVTEQSHTSVAGISVTEPGRTPTATGIQTAALASTISSLITALVLMSIFIAVLGIYCIKKARSNSTGHRSVANEDVVYEVVDEILHDRNAMSIKINDAYQAANVTVDMEDNEAYGIHPV